MKNKTAKFNLNSNNQDVLKYLIKDLSKIKGIEIQYNKNNINNLRGSLDFSLISSIVITSLAIPAILKTFEIFLNSKKIDLEISIPNQDIKIKLSAFSKEKLQKELLELNKIFIKNINLD